MKSEIVRARRVWCVVGVVCLLGGALVYGWFGREEAVCGPVGPVAPGWYLRISLASGNGELLSEAPAGNWSESDVSENIVLREIPAGEFAMGAAAQPNDFISRESPVHRVKISRPFFIGVHEVTRAQWQAALHGVPQAAQGRPFDPITYVSYNDCKDFLVRLTLLSKDWSFRLPTEAEWEYACRLGCRTDGAHADETFWCAANSGMRVHRVGALGPDRMGVCDMLGNVWEWCQDAEHVYGEEDVTDPVSLPPEGYDGLVAARGGGYRNRPDICTPTHRGFFHVDFSECQWGLRIVAEPKSSER